jgi:hypothetical protein
MRGGFLKFESFGTSIKQLESRKHEKGARARTGLPRTSAFCLCVYNIFLRCVASNRSAYQHQRKVLLAPDTRYLFGSFRMYTIKDRPSKCTQSRASCVSSRLRMLPNQDCAIFSGDCH